MFGYSPLQLYFITNLIYTIFTFIFLHNIIAEKMYMEYKELTSKEMKDKDIQTSMFIFYILSSFTGSFRLFKDIINLILDHKECIWLYRIYNKKNKECEKK